MNDTISPADATHPSPDAWPDLWLLEEFRRVGHPAAGRAERIPAASAWDALSAAGISDRVILKAACSASGLALAHLSEVGARHAALLPGPVALRHGVVPVRVHDGALEVASANPLRAGLAREIGATTPHPVRLVVAAPSAVRSAQELVYGAAAGPSAIEEYLAVPEPAPVPQGAGWSDLVLRGGAIEVLDQILAAALRDRASDVHLEPKADGMLVRFRVDGVLHDAGKVPAKIAPALVSRVKVTANLDIADRIRPQDGRSVVRLGDRPVDLRVSTLPLGGMGEKVVIRILDAQVNTVGLEKLGFAPAELHRVHKLLSQREGMVLTTGPTGSGKTTTLYSALAHVRSGETNVVTVEDPIEYRLDGINQVQVNEKAGLTFASALRSILRQDPDVVLVGEIRDAETAGIAIKASMTGHLVLATLHTNDAPSAVARLADIGVDLGALSGALKGVVAQRLVRRLCEECSRPMTLAELSVDQQMLLTGKRTDGLRSAVGCPACRATGYRGRMVVAEILVVDGDMQHAIARGASVAELVELARGHGMQSLWESGLERVLDGTTTLHELVDNVPPLFTESSSNQSDVDALLAQLLGAKGPVTPAGPPAASAPVVPVGRPPVPPATRLGGERGARVLVVDDDREARRVLRAELEGEGFRVIEAADGEAGLVYVRRLRPDLVITEVALPRLDGIGLLQALAGEPQAPPVVVHTHQTDPALLEWARELGARETLTRPAPVRALTACLQAARRSAA